jgi:hypothetical protein
MVEKTELFPAPPFAAEAGDPATPLPPAPTVMV